MWLTENQAQSDPVVLIFIYVQTEKTLKCESNCMMCWQSRNPTFNHRRITPLPDDAVEEFNEFRVN